MTKEVFIAFAIEDVAIRDLIKGQSLNTKTPFEFIDMSVKQAYDEDWKKKVRTRIKRSKGVLAVVSSDSLTSTGQTWELQCAKEESKKRLGIWGYTDDRTKIEGLSTVAWTWEALANFIDSLPE